MLFCHSLPTHHAAMNIYFLKKNLVATDHCSVHKLLGQRTETRTEWPKFLHHQAVPFNVVSSLRSRKGMKIIWFRSMSNLHCNSQYESTHPGRLLVDKDRTKRLPFQCWSCIKINASVIKNIKPSAYSRNTHFPVFSLWPSLNEVFQSHSWSRQTSDFTWPLYMAAHELQLISSKNHS